MSAQSDQLTQAIQSLTDAVGAETQAITDNATAAGKTLADIQTELDALKNQAGPDLTDQITKIQALASQATAQTAQIVATTAQLVTADPGGTPPGTPPPPPADTPV